jgi:hypothetical protein
MGPITILDVRIIVNDDEGVEEGYSRRFLRTASTR